MFGKNFIMFGNICIQSGGIEWFREAQSSRNKDFEKNQLLFLSVTKVAVTEQYLKCIINILVKMITYKYFCSAKIKIT